MKPRVSTIPSASLPASILLTGMILWVLSNMQRTVWKDGLLYSLCLALTVCAATSCSQGDDSSPAVATAEVTLSRPRVALGSPVDMTYRFKVATDMPSGTHRVFVHLVDADEELM